VIRILAQTHDLESSNLLSALQQRGAQAELWTLPELTETCGLTLRIDTRGACSRVSTRDGRTFRSDDPVLVINRLQSVAARSGGDAFDAEYVAEEWRAVLAAWLRTLRGPVLNPPRAATLSGPALSSVQWRAIAHAHGLRTVPVGAAREHEASETLRVTCLMARCFAATPVPEPIASSLAAIGRYCGTPLMQACFERNADQLSLADIDPQPTLSTAPDAVLRALIEASQRLVEA
jgi:hypothetical protein